MASRIPILKRIPYHLFESECNTAEERAARTLLLGPAFFFIVGHVSLDVLRVVPAKNKRRKDLIVAISSVDV